MPDNFYANLEATSKFNYDYDIAKIGAPIDRKELGMTPQTVNAHYNPTDNTINFPAAILQPPFFDAKADDAINYGGIGTVIGHEASQRRCRQQRQRVGPGRPCQVRRPHRQAGAAVRRLHAGQGQARRARQRQADPW